MAENLMFIEEIENSDEDTIDIDNTYEEILNRMLNNVDEKFDKREGSIIYTSLSPIAIELMLIREELKFNSNEGFADTASLDSLILRANERGVEHIEATNAIVRGKFSPNNIDIEGCIYTVENTEMSYTVGKKISNDDTYSYYELECTTSGTDGNIVSGKLIIDSWNNDAVNISDVNTAEIDQIITPAINDEDVEELRLRYFENIDTQYFGGNVADYKEKMLSTGKCKACKIFRAGDNLGDETILPGHVYILFLDSNYNIPNETTINEIQTLIDPTKDGGGLGLAPIGHIVTINKPTEISIHIKFDIITFIEGFTFESLQDQINSAIDSYFNELKIKWGNSDNTIVNSAHLVVKMMSIDGIENVSITIGKDETTYTNTVSIKTNEVAKRGNYSGI